MTFAFGGQRNASIFKIDRTLGLIDRALGLLDGSLDLFLPIRAFRRYHLAKSVGAPGTLFDVLNDALIGLLDDALL